MSWCPSGVRCSAALSADFNYRRYGIAPCPASRETRVWRVGFGLGWLPWLRRTRGPLCLCAHCPVALLSAPLIRLRGTAQKSAAGSYAPRLSPEAAFGVFCRLVSMVRSSTSLCFGLPSFPDPRNSHFGHQFPPIALDPKFRLRGSCSSLY